jgi:hypothetical protein
MSKNSIPRELPFPDDVLKFPDSGEVLRAWIINKNLQVSLDGNAFPTPIAWGVLLADVTRHISGAMESQGYGDYLGNLSMIKEVIERELSARPSFGTVTKSQSN